MAKTIQQIQAMITNGYDVRQIINEIADYLQANPGGGGGVSPNVQQALTDGAVIEWDFSLGNIATITIGGDRALSVSNIAANSSGILIVKQDGIGGRTLDVIGETPLLFSLSANPGGEDVLGFFYDGINFYWDIQNYGTGVDVLEDIVFDSSFGLINTAQVYTTAAGAPWGSYGSGDRKLAAGSDGYIQFKYDNADVQDFMFSFDDRFNSEPYSSNHYMAGMVFISGVLRSISGATLNAYTGALALNSYARVQRVGSTFTIKTSPDLVNWTTVYTFPYTSSADMFICLNLEASGGVAKIRNPKVFNSVAA